MTPVCRRLSVTATFPHPGHRRYHWLATPGAARLGVAVVCQGFGRDTETYAVDEDPTCPFPGRAWFFHRETGEVTTDRLGTYRVELTPAGVWRCDCSGFNRSRTCKHADTCKSLHEFGDLDPEPAAAH